jgi:NADPH:quinone reductase-like Zn-dependent oxidoreductase
MRATQINSYGDQNVMQTTTNAPKPTPDAGQVLVEVHAASVNPFDWKVRAGLMSQMTQLAFPATLGGDVAGVVAELGEGVEGFSIGQEVYGQASALSGQGSFAEFTPVKAESLARKPHNVDFITAAALPLTAVSAYQALADTLHVGQGQRVLIHGGAGGIGAMAIQLAKHLGAYVATTVSTGDTEYARELGADQVIDYTSQKFEEVVRDMDAVYDTVGSDTYARSFTVLKQDGQIVSMLEQPNQELMRTHGVTATHQSTILTPERLAKVADLADQGVLKVTIDKVFPLEQAAEALEYLRSGHHRGKVVIKVKE